MSAKRRLMVAALLAALACGAQDMREVSFMTAMPAEKALVIDGTLDDASASSSVWKYQTKEDGLTSEIAKPPSSFKRTRAVLNSGTAIARSNRRAEFHFLRFRCASSAAGGKLVSGNARAPNVAR